MVDCTSTGRKFGNPSTHHRKKAKATDTGDGNVDRPVESRDGFFGGLALFLGGLEILSEGLKKAAGQALEVALAKLTTNRFTGAPTGAFVTGVLNSSTVTTVLVVGFVTAGMMTLGQCVGVIMGANIGSTVTAQLLAFNLSAYALLPVAVGIFTYFAGRPGPTGSARRRRRGANSEVRL